MSVDDRSGIVGEVGQLRGVAGPAYRADHLGVRHFDLGDGHDVGGDLSAGEERVQLVLRALLFG